MTHVPHSAAPGGQRSPRKVAGGAYGLQLASDLALPDLIVPPQSWPRVEVEQQTREDLDVDGHRVEGSLATVGIQPGMAGLVDREARTATLVSPVPWSPASIVHPFLAAPGALFAWWSGRAALHGGAFAGAGGAAWAL